MQHRFRYDGPGRWFKGNTHIHSTASDGGTALPDIAALYAGAGYDFIFLTDHWVASDAAAVCPHPPLLLIDGIELDGRDSTGAYYHVVCLGKTHGLRKEDGLERALAEARRQGALTVLAHPRWTGNSDHDARRWRFDGVEVYNHVCRWLNGKDNGSAHWDAMLRDNPATLGLAADDAHLKPEHPGWNGGWVMVRSEDGSAEAIVAALRRGSFYSSCGPEFRWISLDGTAVCFESSPVQFARLVGPGFAGHRVGSFDGTPLTAARFDIPAKWPYAVLEIEDDRGRRAWTNALTVEC